jgi:predicted N-acetyltransferase YhbS
MLILLPLLTLISPIASLSLPITNNQQQPLPSTKNAHTNNNLKTHFRDIQPADLPAITTILVEAFSPSATWHYLMPDLQHHKPEVWTCLHAQVEYAWETRNTSTSFGKIITVIQEEDQEEIPASFSLWTIRHREKDSPSTSTTTSFFSPQSIFSALHDPCPIPPGTNLTRALKFARQNAAVEHKYFDLPYAHRFNLNLLATHPSWDGNGFGARHVQWGQNFSLTLEPKMPVTLLASPAGYPLYDSLGFESVKNATMPMLDDLGQLWFEVMDWNA